MSGLVVVLDSSLSTSAELGVQIRGADDRLCLCPFSSLLCSFLTPFFPFCFQRSKARMKLLLLFLLAAHSSASGSMFM